MRHPAVAHVVHRQQRPRVQRRDVGGQPVADGEGAARIAGAAHVLREDGERIGASRLDQHVERLGHGDAELVDADRVHVLAVGGDHRHLQSGDADVEVGHRRGVDEAQQHLLARAEQPGPVARGRGAVEQVGVGVGVDVGDVGRGHPHPPPHSAVGQRGLQAVATDVVEEVARRAPVEVVVFGHLLHAREQRGRVHVRPVRQQHHVLAVVFERWRLQRVHHDGAVQAGLLLVHRVAVVPVGPRLLQREAVGPGLARVDAVEAQAGHAVHVGRQQDAVPVDRGRLVAKPVGHPQGDRVALAPAQQRPGQGTVDGGRRARAAGEVDRCTPDRQVEIGATQFHGAGGRGVGGERWQSPQSGAPGDAGRGQASHEPSAAAVYRAGITAEMGGPGAGGLAWRHRNPDRAGVARPHERSRLRVPTAGRSNGCAEQASHSGSQGHRQRTPERDTDRSPELRGPAGIGCQRTQPQQGGHGRRHDPRHRVRAGGE